MVKLGTRQTGRCGELLVQYKLLKHGIESSSLTTDKGIDLVAFDNVRQKAVTIQVKTVHQRPAGGRGKIALGWTVRDDCPAEYIACVDLTREKFWLISSGEFRLRAQQHNRGNSHLWWFVQPSPRAKVSAREEEFAIYEMDNAIDRVFGLRHDAA